MEVELAKITENDQISENESEGRALLPLIQALIISSEDPITLETIVQVSESDQQTVLIALKILAEMLENDSYGFSLVQVSKGYQFRTKPIYARYIRSLRQESPRKLSPAALETLAIIAYRQPVVKHDIDGLRGVDVAPTLKTLLDRELIQIVGHKDTVGHPALYSTTDEFLRVFGLNSIEDLPTVKELNNIQGDPGEQGAANFANPITQDSLENMQTSLA